MPSPSDTASPLTISDRERTRLTALLDALPSAAALFAAAGTLVAINQRGRELFVVDEIAPLESQQWRVVLQPLGAAAAEAIAAAKARAPLQTRTVPFGLDGPIVDLRVTVFDSDLLLVSAVDATEREQRRAALERADRELATIFDLTPSSVRIVDMDGRIRRQNANAEREHAERQPATVRELWELDKPHCVQNVRPLPFLDTPAMKAFAGIIVSRQLLEVQRLGTARTIEAYAAPMRDADGQVCGVVLLDRDVTDREQLSQLIRDREMAAQASGPPLNESELQRLVEERSRDLLAAQEDTVRERRLAAIGQLAAGVMHDLNNALNPIMAAAYLLRHHAESPDAVREYADRIKTASETAAATASRVGRFIRQEPVHAGGDEEMDLSVLVNEVLDLTEPVRKRPAGEAGEVRVVRQLGPDVCARGLPGEIREALLNLVQNAMDAMPTGGTLTVRTVVEGRDACVFVRDTGVGMTAEVRERAFEPFFTTKGRKGSGLGLAEVYGIMRRNRGTVHISSELGRGTEVVLRLPVEQTQSAPTPPVVPAVSSPQRILVVEDHDDGREFLRRILQGDRHIVDAVGTCADARRRLEAASPPPYDILLTDVGLPDGSGWDLVAFARAVAPGVRVGVITGWEPAADTSEAQGAEFVLRKPLRAMELKAHIAGGYSPPSTSE
ncbi:MAG: response regulator [Gemmatimonadaceae bacterium]|nr:response regulator [Gemmatimonadaceae bacterium]